MLPIWAAAILEEFSRRRTISDRNNVLLSCQQARPLKPPCLSQIETILSKTGLALVCSLSLMDTTGKSEYNCVPTKSSFSGACADDILQCPGESQDVETSDREVREVSERDEQTPKVEKIETGRLGDSNRGSAHCQGRVFWTKRSKRSGVKRQLVRNGHWSRWSMSYGRPAWQGEFHQFLEVMSS